MGRESVGGGRGFVRRGLLDRRIPVLNSPLRKPTLPRQGGPASRPDKEGPVQAATRMAKRSTQTVPPGEPSDEQLLARFLRGDRAAFDTLVLRYKDRAYWVAYGIVRDMEESLDLAQEAFARALMAAESFDPKLKFSTWYFRILVNLCIDTLRKRKTRRTLTGADAPDPVYQGASPDEDLERSEVRGMVEEILAILPENHRTLLVLRDIQGLSCIEIAQIVGCTHATARWRLHRARGKFREAWEERYGPWGSEQGSPGA